MPTCSIAAMALTTSTISRRTIAARERPACQPDVGDAFRHGSAHDVHEFGNRQSVSAGRAVLAGRAAGAVRLLRPIREARS
ncbi:MAG: hypothetical protein HZB53_22120 [Chloroflexi bacterium]|nr:hypothetical protein [Chloroflexota bacterium]